MSHATVEVLAPGFVVKVDGRPYPKAYPADRVLIFRGVRAARRFAAAIDRDDMTACHELIERYGEWYAGLSPEESAVSA